MTFDEFRASLKRGTKPPHGLSAPLRALWLDAKGDWAGAHNTVNDLETKEAARVHAYLHRAEGDRDNARYWYNRAGVKPEVHALEGEWEGLARALLGEK
ncbi:MAG TPA: hypothetical protein VN903_34375 [Polyangia bacterium]|jgi:hypothetical protein|nr:hypothetical protein [Polyangia bacterium]